MADESFEWAKQFGEKRYRINEAHKEEEAKLVLNDKFSTKTSEGWEGKQTGHFEMDDVQLH